MNYAINLHGSTFTPDGKVTLPSTDQHNAELESKEIAWLKTHPDKVTLYAKLNPTSGQFAGSGTIQTWLGTALSLASFGARKYIGFGHHTYRRAVTCTLYGVKYHGWYMESSGDYVRLVKSKATR